MKPVPQRASARPSASRSASAIVSVAIGVPSKSVCAVSGPMRCSDQPHAPAPTASAIRRSISARSASFGLRRFAASTPITQYRIASVGA